MYFKLEFERDFSAAKVLIRYKKSLEATFNAYSTPARRGYKNIQPRDFKKMLRDMQIIPMLTSEMKSGKVY